MATNKEELNYRATLSCWNNATAYLSFHADSAELAEAHVHHLLHLSELSGFDWDEPPNWIYYISYQKEGNKKSKYLYNRATDKMKESAGKPQKKLIDYWNENNRLKHMLSTLVCKGVEATANDYQAAIDLLESIN